jgi:hypothetical protein
MDYQNTPITGYEEALRRVESQKDIMIPEARRREGKAEGIVDELDRLINNITYELPELLERASSLPDGTPVFMSRAFKVFDAHRKEVAAELLGAIIWKDNAPTYEEYVFAQERAHPVNTKPAKAKRAEKSIRRGPMTLQEYLRRVVAIQNLESRSAQLKLYRSEILPYIRRRLTDEMNPPSIEEMEIYTAMLNSRRMREVVGKAVPHA